MDMAKAIMTILRENRARPERARITGSRGKLHVAREENWWPQSFSATD
jgi:hypothetical protein